MNRLLLLTLCLLLAAALLIAVAWSSPVKSTSQLTFPYCGTNPYFAPSCDAFAQAQGQSFLTLSPQFPHFYLYQSSAEIAEGLAALTLVLLLLHLDSKWLHKPPMPRLPRWLVIAAVAPGVSIFGFLVILNVNEYNASLSFARPILASFPTPPGTNAVGVIASLAWATAFAVVILKAGFVKTVKTFVAPTILFLTLVIFSYDRVEMTLHVTDFTTWAIGGIPLVSNWLLLVVSAGLLGWAILE
ncbi:MAG: hypothetical protein ACLP9K_04280 [Nitrososphaerales archaeon]